MAENTTKQAFLTRRELLKAIAVGTTASIVSTSQALEAEDYSLGISSQEVVAWRRYKFTMSLNVPRIYDNSKSLGYRKYQRQKIVGTMTMGFDEAGELVDFQFYDLVNKTHKLSNGKNVTYDGVIDYDAHYPLFNAVGNNKTKSFRTASICFALAAEPSYNIGEFDEDTSLYITLAGKGTIDAAGTMKRAQGYAAGTLGCGCKAYGHTSPTRELGYNGATDIVTDVASVYGNWTLRLDA